MAIGLACGLIGVLLFWQKRLLLAETLSHAVYPGLILGVGGGSLFSLFAGAAVAGALAMRAVRVLEKQKVSADSALTVVLSLFFGAGVVGSTFLQGYDPIRKVEVERFLFGQAATLSDAHAKIYGGAALLCLAFVFFFYRPLQALLFDRSLKRHRLIQGAIALFSLLAVLLGIRSVGVVLLSAMMIAPAVAAWAFARSLKESFFVAAFVGATSGLIGNGIASAWGWPTGPTIVLIGASLAVFSLLFAPNKGLFIRQIRRGRFFLRCFDENLMKGLWKGGGLDEGWLYRWRLRGLHRKGWLVAGALTSDGKKRAEQIVRLHRLWELYLTEELGVSSEKVHRSAEEMEHILTPEMERRLTDHLGSPLLDPHQQPIPEKRWR